MKKQNMGSDFDDFLAQEGLLEEVAAVAVKRVIAWHIEQEMAAQKRTKTAMAKRRRTSRASLNRLLDENDTSLTLTTLAGHVKSFNGRRPFAEGRAKPGRCSRPAFCHGKSNKSKTTVWSLNPPWWSR